MKYELVATGNTMKYKLQFIGDGSAPNHEIIQSGDPANTICCELMHVGEQIIITRLPDDE